MRHRLFILSLATVIGLGTLLPAGTARAQPANGVSAIYHAKELQSKADFSGDPVAATELGYMYQTGAPGLKKDYERALYYYQMAANADYGDAETNLGVLYANGLGTAQNYGQALVWFTQAAKHGNTLAAYNLGNLYYLGNGTKVDYVQAVGYYTMAAKAGNSDAEYALGKAYLEGNGVKQSDADATKWLLLAADQGNGAAERHMAEIYKAGKGAVGAEANAAGMFDMYKKAAFKGDPNAEYNYGQMIETGAAGITADVGAAIQWYWKAANQGQADAQHALGKAFYTGKGIPQDFRQAWFWYALAAKTSHKPGYGDDRDEASQHVPPAELDADELQVYRWKPTREQAVPH